MPRDYGRIYAAVRKIPRGRVATYGQVARLAGLPRRARLAGYAMSLAPAGLPWHRVVNASGRVSARAHPYGAAHQRELLEDEQVVFGASGRIALRRYQWRRGLRP